MRLHKHTDPRLAGAALVREVRTAATPESQADVLLSVIPTESVGTIVGDDYARSHACAVATIREALVDLLSQPRAQDVPKCRRCGRRQDACAYCPEAP